mmetsp:Transcript_18515/g.34716  ORF Transcript_18515/g.34716 Transcript_18515/m.34716 type:complete len:260 (-) Transcript_18515:502-1281(-)
MRQHEFTLVPKLVGHPEDRNAVVASVRNEHKVARVVHSNSATRVHVARPGIWNSSDSLHQPQRGRGVGHVRAAHEILRGVSVKSEDRHLRRQLIHHVSVRERRMELDVARSESRFARWARPARPGSLQAARLRIEPELTDEVHAKIRDIRDLAEERVQNHRMGVRIALPLLLRVRIVLGVVHVFGVAHLHASALIGVIDTSGAAHQARVSVDAKHANGGVPVVHNEQVLAGLVQGQVTGRRAPRVLTSQFRQFAGGCIN